MGSPDTTQAMRVDFLLTRRHLWQYHWYWWRRHAGRRLLLLAALCLILPALNFIPGYNSGVSGTLALSAFLSVMLFLAQGVVFVSRLLFGFRKTLKSGTAGERFAEIGKFEFVWAQPRRRAIVITGLILKTLSQRKTPFILS